MLNGQSLSLKHIDDGIVELCFGAQKGVNTLNRVTLGELEQAVDMLSADSSINGLLVSSDKDAFIVGADITEFTDLFSGPRQNLIDAVRSVHTLFNRFEDLPFPKVAAINGFALGGGFELALACEFRIMADSAVVGFPEVKLGIIPGYGGTVRASRVMGCDNALKWICTGKHVKASEALSLEAVDSVVSLDQLRQASLQTIRAAISGDFDYASIRDVKKQPVLLNDMERLMSFTAAKGLVAGQAGPHYPAPMAALAAVEKHCTMQREEAGNVEIEHFAEMAATDVAAALVGLFLNEQAVGKKAKVLGKAAPPTRHAAVLGAGIMGGGIAYQSAVKGIPALMNDIAQEGLDTGIEEASALLSKQVKRGKLSVEKMAAALNRITPVLEYPDMAGIDVVVEAVVENAAVKKKVLAECESLLHTDAVLCSNTSTIRISELAASLQRPENFCGMHFFNPVHRMPLVEVIRGEQTSDATIARTMAYASSLGKTPVLVNDCAGFLVNRVLFPYLAAFNLLLREGADFQQVDRVMEKFGWPMGPAYLVDVVGIDTCVHAAGVLAEAFPERMGIEYTTAMQAVYDDGRLGQKNDKGFYQYLPDRKGRLQKTADPLVSELVAGHVQGAKEFSDEEIIDRLMIPMCLELVRCLDEGVVATPAEADIALIMGIGFPMFRGGVCRYIDTLGVDKFCESVKVYESIGPQYRLLDSLVAMVDTKKTFY